MIEVRRAKPAHFSRAYFRSIIRIERTVMAFPFPRDMGFAVFATVHIGNIKWRSAEETLVHELVKLDRRRLLATAGTLAICGSSLVSADDGSRRSSLPLADDFASHLGDKFLLEDESGRRIEASLVEVRPSKSVPRAGFRKPFSIVFSLPASRLMGQAVYRLKHRSLGTMRLLLVPISPLGSRPLLESVFG